MKKPYIKKYSEISGFKVFIVDGEYIRDKLDEEFTNFGQHYQFDFIPKNEFWIDKERVGWEYKYYINSMLTINRLLKKGVNYRKAIKIADKEERSERAKSGLMKRRIKLKKYPEKLIQSVHKNLLQKYSTKKIKVWIVSGELVRDLFFIDFTEGGHGYVYSFIPKDEIWLDDDLEPDEIKFVLLHELHERNLMAKGWCYDTDTRANLKTGKIKKPAHPDSSRIEYACRRKKKNINEELKKEIEKNEEI
jgi:hypothetical protein